MKEILLCDLLHLSVKNNKICIISFNYCASSFEKTGNLKMEAIVETIAGEERLINLFADGVQNLSVDNVSGTMYIEGFEILDHSDDGWQKELILEVNDFEDGKIHFHAREIRGIVT